ncbi:MAG: septation protein IspZ [Bacteriovoracaceae bacterium]|nr:septation protein IspZ [Bacteriovoracaceae bacterium]
MKNFSKSFFILSFLPAFGYWYLEESYSIKIALIGGLILASFELLLEWLFTRKLHSLSKFNFFIILFLGSIAFIGDQGIWFKLQPAISGIAISIFLVFKLLTGEGLMVEMLKSLNSRKIPPKWIIRTLEMHLAIFFFLYSTFMGGVAFWGTTSSWLFFKTIGMYLVFVIFFIFELIYIKILIRRLDKRATQISVLRSMTGEMDLTEEI